MLQRRLKQLKKFSKEKTMGSKRPPIGLKPKYIHNQDRQLDILDAITRYVKEGITIPKEWIDELSFNNQSFYDDAIIEFRYKMNEAIEEFERKIASRQNKPSEKFEGFNSIINSNS